MKFLISTAKLTRAKVDLLAIPVFQDKVSDNARLDLLDKEFDGLLSRSIRDDGFSGKNNQAFAFHTHDRMAPKKIYLVGLGKPDGFTPEGVREFASRAVHYANRTKCATLAIALPEKSESEENAARWEEKQLYPHMMRMLTVGAVLGAYSFTKYLTRKQKPPRLKEVRFLPGAENGVWSNQSSLRESVKLGAQLGQGVCLARDLVNEPGNTATPSYLAQEARELAREEGLICKVLMQKDLERLKMGCFLGVTRGSEEAPCLISLTYRPKGRKKGGGKPLALVGKGITFDSGGLSLKPPKSMQDMKVDMAGAAAVLGAMKVAARLKPSRTIMGLIGCCENMPSGKATKPGDILTAANGMTVEVLNTDAEGRLVLADLLHYAVMKGAGEIIDMATLTGACVIALGPYTAGFMCNNEEMAARFLQSAKLAGEDIWRLPLVEKLAESLRGGIADLKNIGAPYGGAISAGLFLREFIGDTPWVHLDIAGPASRDNQKSPSSGSGTGFGVLTAAEYISKYA